MFELPDNKDAKIAVLNHLRDASATNINIHKVRWLISHYWLQGLRNFSTNYVTGTIRWQLGNQQDRNGNLRLLFEDVVVKLQEELGRLMRMDIRPSTAPRGYGLDRIRSASSGRVILDYLSAPTDWDKLKEMLFYHLAVYGTVGVGVWVRDETLPGLLGEEQDAKNEKEGEQYGGQSDDGRPDARSQFELIPAWELYPIPFNPESPEAVRGILRKRWSELSWVRKHKKLRFPGKKDEALLQIRMSPPGVKPASTTDGLGVAGLPGTTGSLGLPLEKNIAGNDKRDVEYVELEEYFFFHEEKDKLCRYIVKVGDHIALDETYYDRSVYCPIGIARYHPIGGFYGRSFVEILIPINSEAEQMLASLFQNVKDMDAFGILMMPNGVGISKNELLKKDKTRKVCFYDPDPTMDSRDKAYAINPVTTSDFPGKVAALANSVMDRLTRQSEMMRGQAPGRMDSAAGLGFLNEMANIPLSVPANSVASALAQVYRALLAAAPNLLSNGNGEIPLIGLDDSLIGLVVKPNSGVVSLNPANFPIPSQLEVGIRDKLPSPPTIRIQKILESFKMGILSPLDLKITVWKENLDFPVGSWEEEQSYRKSILQCILLFGDGENPGQAIASTEADNPKIALKVFQQFMAKPEFTFAGVEVRNAFEEMKKVYQGMLGQQYPEPLGYPEDEASIMDAMQGQMGGPPAPR